jgi:hypothetical protein
MHTTKLVAFALSAALASASLAACDLDVADLNNPSVADLENNPTPVSIAAASTGLLIGNRSNMAAENGYIAQLGILGREAYNFDSADPRFVSELIQGQLNSGSPFGGNFWGLPYANIQLGNIVLHAVDKVAALDDSAKSAIRGFAKTIQALDLLEVINAHDTNGAVIDTDHPVTAPLGAIVSKQATFDEIERLLDDAVGDLSGGGDAFPFLLSEGFSGFDTPATFLTFNRAIRARVAAYQPTPDYPKVLEALGVSFLDDSDKADFRAGVYYTYTTKTGDVANGLINPNIFAHPSIQTDAQKNGADVTDLRLAAKVKDKKPGGAKGLSSSLGFTEYSSPSSPVPLIRNEELILLKAEALYFTGLKADAITELNKVRTKAGGLKPLVGEPTDDVFIDELLYERRYSLLFEGHRWIDLRRFKRLATLPIDKPEHTRNVRYPIPLTECNARPNEAACSLGSVDM